MQRWICAVLLAIILLAPIMPVTLNTTPPSRTTIVRATLSGNLTISPYGQSNITTNFTIRPLSSLVLNFTGVNLTGVTKIWAWFSTNNSTAINKTDAWFVGPIDTQWLTWPSGTAADYSGVMSATFAPNSYIAGYISFKNDVMIIHLPVQLVFDQKYYVKVTDLPPSERNSIGPNDTLVSTGYFIAKPGFSMTDILIDGYPTNIMIGAADPSANYTITINTTNGLKYGPYKPSLRTIPGMDYNPPWNWTGYNITVIPPPFTTNKFNGDIYPNATMIDNTSNKTLSWMYLYYYEPELFYWGSYNNYVYPGTIINDASSPLLTGTTIKMWFSCWRSLGSINVYINNTWHVIDNLPLDIWGGNLTRINYDSYIYIPLPPSLPRPGYYNITITDGYDTLWFLAYVEKVPNLSVSEKNVQVGDTIQVVLNGAGNYTDYYMGVYYTLPSTPTDTLLPASPTNSSLLSLAVLNSSTTVFNITIPPCPGGYHMIWLGDPQGHQYPGFTPEAINVKVLPTISVIPGNITELTPYITIICSGLELNYTYELMMDSSILFTGKAPNDLGIINVTIPATGLIGQQHSLILYRQGAANETGTPVATTIIGSSINIINNTNQLSQLLTLLNNTYVNTVLLQSLLNSLGENISLRIIGVNQSLAELIISGIKLLNVLGNNVTEINSTIIKIFTSLTNLNATLTSIQGDTAIIQTAIGNITTTLEELNLTSAKLTNLVITKTGEIIGTINTTYLEINASLQALNSLADQIVGLDKNLTLLINKVLSRINNTDVKIDELKTLIKQLEANTTIQLKSINETQVKLALTLQYNDQKEHLEILTRLSELNATVSKILGNTMVLDTKLGKVMLNIETLIKSGAELKSLIITSTGEIKGLITTSTGNLTISLKDLKKAVLDGLKVDYEALSQKLADLLNAIESLNTTVSGKITGNLHALNSLSKSVGELNNLVKVVEEKILSRITIMNQSISSVIMRSVATITRQTTMLNNTLTSILAGQNSLSAKIESSKNIGTDIKSYLEAKTGELKTQNNMLYSSMLQYQYATLIMVGVTIALSIIFGLKKK